MQPRNPEWCGVSQRFCASSTRVRESLVGELVESAGFNVSFYRAVKPVSLQPREPIAEAREVVAFQALHSPFDFFDRGHPSVIAYSVG
jgi:hypothetical protein